MHPWGTTSKRALMPIDKTQIISHTLSGKKRLKRHYKDRALPRVYSLPAAKGNLSQVMIMKNMLRHIFMFLFLLKRTNQKKIPKNIQIVLSFHVFISSTNER